MSRNYKGLKESKKIPQTVLMFNEYMCELMDEMRRLTLKLSQNNMNVTIEDFIVLEWYESKLFSWKHFEPLFMAFEGFIPETNHYITVGAVNALLIDQMGEPFDRLEASLPNTWALSINQLVANLISVKSWLVDHFILFIRLTRKIDYDSLRPFGWLIYQFSWLTREIDQFSCFLIDHISNDFTVLSTLKRFNEITINLIEHDI